MDYALACQGAAESGAPKALGKLSIPNMAFTATKAAPPHLSLKNSPRLLLCSILLRITAA